MTDDDKRNNSGTLSRNRKREHDKQPEFRGSCVIDGVGYWISAWVREGDDGRFFSLAFLRRRSRPRPLRASTAPGQDTVAA